MSNVNTAVPFAAELEELSVRAEKFKRHGFHAMLAAVVCFIVVIIAAGLAWWFTPSLSFTNVDVPKALLEQFSNNSTRVSSSGENVGTGIAAISGTMSEWVPRFGKFVGVIALLWGLVMAVVRQSMVAGMAGVFIAVVTNFVVTAAFDNAIGGSREADTSGVVTRTYPSDRARFISAVNARDGAAAEKLFAYILGPISSKNYVLVQIAYLDALQNDSARVAAVAKAKSLLIDLDKKPSEELKPAVLYVLDTFANGRTTSQVSRDYESERMGSVALMNAFRTGSSTTGVVVGLLGLCLLCIGRLLSNRVYRIKNYIGWVDEPEDENYQK
ncbi:hypothetical protein [Pseudomonas grimontii]|uniref:hypothetical protein n=1 Tax=Pseudomonas grimontii TaxID=129847 RepID=UPI00387A9F70